jgi:hypothetical protein
MRRTRWIRWGLGLFAAGLIVVFTSLLSVFTTWNLVNMYMKELLRPVAALAGQGTNVEFVQLLSHMLVSLNTMKQAEPGTGRDVAAGVSEGSEAGAEAGAAADDATEARADAEKHLEAGSAASDAGAGSGSAPDTMDEPDAVEVQGKVLSLEDLLRIREQWGEEEAVVLVSELLERLTQEDVQALARMMEGGLTGPELMEVMRILEPHMSEEDLATLRQILEHD